MKQAQVEKIESMLCSLFESAKNNLILPTDQGLQIFGKYTMQQVPHGWAVKKYHDTVQVFSCQRTAISWIIADKYNQWHMASRLSMLDQQKVFIQNDVEEAKVNAHRLTSPDRRDIARSKLTNKLFQLREVNDKISKCVNIAKYWQIRGFNNEIERTKRPASHTANRQGT